MTGCIQRLGSARVSRAGDGVLAIAKFSDKIVSARPRNQHVRRVRYPDHLCE
jgi:hypothetical protein